MTTEVTASATAAAGDIVAPGVTLRPDEGGMARYSGSRADLIAFGVASAEMFPADGKGRRISSQSTERESNEYFCISRFPWRHKYGSCDSFMVARWVHWNNPAEGKKARASLGQERQAEQEAHRKYREENAARRSQLRRWNIVMAPLRAIMNISVW